MRASSVVLFAGIHQAPEEALVPPPQGEKRNGVRAPPDMIREESTQKRKRAFQEGTSENVDHPL